MPYYKKPENLSQHRENFQFIADKTKAWVDRVTTTTEIDVDFDAACTALTQLSTECRNMFDAIKEEWKRRKN